MILISNDDQTKSEEEEVGDEDAMLADDLLDEVSEGDAAGDSVEGFGLLKENDADSEEEEEDGVDSESEPLEDGAEDVEFDRFDDVDEM
jgi:hypothetical protein